MTVWADRARIEYTLRVGAGSSRVLMMRHCDEQGQDHGGNEVPWREVAVIASYNDADRILSHLRLGAVCDRTACKISAASVRSRL